MAARKPLFINTSGALEEISTVDNVDPATLGSGTRDGTKYLRDDGTWQGVTASAAPAGSSGAVQFNNGGIRGGAANVAIDNGDLTLTVNASPVTPPANNTKIFAKSQAGRIMPAFVGPSGLDSVLQPHLAKNGWAMWKITPSVAAPVAYGIGALTAVGTATLAAYATTSLYTRATKTEYLFTTAATTAVAGFWTPTASMIWRVTDGYQMMFRVGPATGGTVATRRFFCGMSTATTAPTDVDPSTLLNVAGVGYSNTDTNWQIYFAGKIGTKVNTGIAKPAADRVGPFTVMVFASPGGAYIGVRIVDEITGTAYEATTNVSANMMATTTASGPRAYHSVGGTSSVVGLGFFGGYMESDN